MKQPTRYDMLWDEVREDFAMEEWPDGEYVPYEEYLEHIEITRVEAQLDTYKRILQMDLPKWLIHKLESEVIRCEELLEEEQ